MVAEADHPRRPTAVVAVGVLAATAILGLAAYASIERSDASEGRTYAAGLARVLDTSEYVEGVAQPVTCPIVDVDRVVDAVRVAVSDDTVLVDAVESHVVYEESPGFPAGVFCNVYIERESAEVPTAVSVSVSQTPLDPYEEFLRSLFDHETTEVFPIGRLRGGDVHPYCVEAIDEEGQTGCGADWIEQSDEIVVGVYLELVRDHETPVAVLDDVLRLIDEKMAVDESLRSDADPGS